MGSLTELSIYVVFLILLIFLIALITDVVICLAERKKTHMLWRQEWEDRKLLMEDVPHRPVRHPHTARIEHMTPSVEAVKSVGSGLEVGLQSGVVED